MDLAYKSEDAVVLASGGQDSTTCLAWAKKHFNKVYAISFFYGQKHSVENEIAQKICDSMRQSLRFTRTCPSQNQKWPLQSFHGLFLRRI